MLQQVVQFAVELGVGAGPVVLALEFFVGGNEHFRDETPPEFAKVPRKWCFNGQQEPLSPRG